MQAYPLIFRFSAVVVTERFRARVRGTGRTLAVIEDGEWVCAGVQPAGLVEPGDSPVGAYLGFRKTLSEILEQIADDSESVEDFARRVCVFFGTRDEKDSQRWLQAVEALRSREEPPGQEVGGLPRLTAETQPEVQIEGANAFHEQSEVLSLAEPLPKAA